MSEICVDASVGVKWAVKGEPFRAKARALLKECGAKGITIIAPPTFEAEVDSAIRKRVFDGCLIPTEAQKAYRIIDSLSVRIVTVVNLRQRAREIAEQFNQRFVYDSIYAALAELRGCDFWTADKKFFNAVKASLPFVKYLGDYTGLSVP